MKKPSLDSDRPTPAYRSATRPPRRSRASAHRESPVNEDIGEAFIARDGRALRLRWIRPTDAPALQRAFARLTPEQIRARFFYRMTELSDELAQRLCDVDPERVVALVITDPDGTEIRGEARAHLDIVTQTGEFALEIDPAFLGAGLGRALMTRLADESRARGIVELWGDVLAGNHAMLQFVHKLGLDCTIESGLETGVVRARLALSPYVASVAPKRDDENAAAATAPRARRNERAAGALGT